MLVSVVCSPNMIHSTYPTLALMLGKGMPLFEEGSSESAAALRGHPSSLVETPYLFEETLRNEFGALSPGRGGGDGTGGYDTSSQAATATPEACCPSSSRKPP